MDSCFQKLRFFKQKKEELEDVNYQTLLKEIGYKFQKKGEVVIRRGEIGRTYFVVLRGEVFVMVPVVTDKELEEKMYDGYFSSS